MIGEPARTPYDIHFRLFGFPVRIHPLFWLLAVFIAHGASDRLLGLFVGIFAVFCSILVHELGHAFVQRLFGLRPWITLYGMGGLASYDTAQLMQTGASDWKKQIFISFAGPGAGFFLCGFLLLVTQATGHEVWFDFGRQYRYLFDFEFKPFASYELSLFVYLMVWFNLVWGVINLMPVYPLDGGQITREILLRIDRPSGIQRSLMISMIAAGSLTAFFLFSGMQSAREAARNGTTTGGASLWVIILFGYLCYSSWATLQMISRGRGRW